MISFCIPAHDEEQSLPATLQALHTAGRAVSSEGMAAVEGVRGYEIVVADDSSTDRTGEIARGLGARVVRVEHRQIAATRNSAARASRGDIIIFVDADTIVPVETLRAALRTLESGAKAPGMRRIIGGGAGVNFDGWVPYWARPLLAVLNIAFRFASLAGGCFIFVRREAFEVSGGFDETIFASEEIHFVKALKAHGRFVTLPQRVISSGRKLRTHGTKEILLICLKGLIRGPSIVRQREGLEMWYGPRRADPLYTPEGPPLDLSASRRGTQAG